jgi:hypothetical protein
MPKPRRSRSSALAVVARVGIGVLSVIALASALEEPAGTVVIRIPFAGAQVSLQSKPRAATTACSADNLKVELALTGGAMGTGLYYFTASNVGQAVCDLDGIFGVAVLGAHNRLFTNKNKREWTTDEGQPVSKRPLVLRRSGEATIVVAIGEQPRSGATTCPLIRAFSLTPPQTTRSIRVARGRQGSGLFCQSAGTSVTVYAATSGSPDAR